MPGFLREHSWSIVFSVALHGALIAAFAAAALITFHHSLPTLQPVAVDAVVIDSQVLHAAQRALTERAEQEAARVRAEAEAKVAAQAAETKAASDAKLAAEEERAAQETKAAADEAERMKQAQSARASEAQKVAAAKRAEELQRAEEAKHADEAKRAEDARRAEEKRAAEAKAADDAKHAADLKAKAEREEELRRQLAEEEHVSAVEASPARAQYIARLASRIQNAWIKPPSARAGLDCVVNITQVPGGEVTSAHVSQCNGDAAARQSIENAVYRASPLPAPPDPALFERNLVIHFHPEE
ncbi:MAG TPA: cell envelope integrity protein TolA [Steroidobacteraceae bacterium]|jgi:colicin import membrane protein|nr:cell envelope integrity protein TolA [Steroidobacteraceae bacterium]